MMGSGVTEISRDPEKLAAQGIASRFPIRLFIHKRKSNLSLIALTARGQTHNLDKQDT